MVIIALGEAFISIGIGATGIGIGRASRGRDPRALVATSFWLAYFDFFSIRAERILHDLEGADRVALARDLYAYGHFPMIVGIVFFAFAMKNIVGDVARTRLRRRIRALRRQRALPAHLLGDPDPCRTATVVSRGRFVAAIVLLLLLPVATAPALAALALVTAVWLALHAYELVWWREARAESRSALASS